MARSSWGSLGRRRGRCGWWLRYYDADGVRRLVRAGATIAEAEDFRERIRREVDGGARRREPVSVAEFLIDPYLPLLRARQAETTYARMYGCLSLASRRFGMRPLASLVRADVESFVATLAASSAAPRTQARYVSALHGMFAVAIERGMHPGPNPASRIPLPRAEDVPIPYLGPEEIVALYAACDPIIRPMIVFLGETGCRLGEMQRLGWDDVTSDGRVRILAKKTGRVRHIPLTPLAKSVIDAQRRERGREDTVFHPLKRFDLWAKFQPAARAVGLRRGARLYDLRHWFISGLVRQGVPIPTVVELAGHRNPELVLRRYGVHAPTNAGATAVEALARARGQYPPG